MPVVLDTSHMEKVHKDIRDFLEVQSAAWNTVLTDTFYRLAIVILLICLMYTVERMYTKLLWAWYPDAQVLKLEAIREHDKIKKCAELGHQKVMSASNPGGITVGSIAILTTLILLFTHHDTMMTAISFGSVGAIIYMCSPPKQQQQQQQPAVGQNSEWVQ